MRVSIQSLGLAVILAATVAPTAAESQMTFGINPGARVRVRSSAFGEGRQARRTAHIVAQSADSMTFRLEGRQETVTLRRSDVLGMDGWAGRQSNTLKGLKYGSLGGVVFGALIGASSSSGANCGESGLCFKSSRSEEITYGAIGFGMLGMLGGVIAGAVTHGDRWQALAPPEWSSRINVAPTSSRGVALRVTF